MNAGGWRKLLFLTVPAAAVMAIVMAAAVEVWVRATWKPRKGRPGFFLTDAVRGQRLAAVIAVGPSIRHDANFYRGKGAVAFRADFQTRLHRMP